MPPVQEWCKPACAVMQKGCLRPAFYNFPTPLSFSGCFDKLLRCNAKTCFPMLRRHLSKHLCHPGGAFPFVVCEVRCNAITLPLLIDLLWQLHGQLVSAVEKHSIRADLHTLCQRGVRKTGQQ